MRSNRFQAGSIRQKLWLGFGIIFIGLVVLGAVFFIMTGLQRQAYDTTVQVALTADHIESLDEEMLEARRREKDFLLRFQNQGYESAYEEYLVPQREHIAVALGEIDAVRASTLAFEDGAAIQQALEETYTAIIEYRDISFEVLDSDVRVRTGLVDNLLATNDAMDETAERLNILVVDEAVDEFHVSLLNYLIITQPGHTTLAELQTLYPDALDAVNESLNELQETIDDQAPSQNLDTMHEQLEGMQSLFQQISTSDPEIGQEFEEFRNAAHQVDPVVDDLLEVTDKALSDADTSLASINNAAYVFQLLTILTTLLLALFAIGTLARSLVTRVERLTGSAHRMSKGDYSQRADASDQDEIGQLAGAFNAMASAVEERSTALTQLNASLEQRIYDRTRELEVATREAREASRLKDEFLAVMSHELRTPLNAIIGYQGIMMMASELEDEDRYRVERTRSNAQRLLNLIDDILNISRIESGRLQIVPTPIDLRALTKKLKSETDVLAAEKGLEFILNVEDSVPETILTDEDAITKIITNLLSNAFKFTEQGSVSLRIHADSLACQIEVRDTGEGIPAHMHEVIFERFRQVDGSTKRKVGGTGLGLAIVQQLVKAMNGSINVMSEPKQGSTFIVTLPLLPTPIPESTMLEETHA